MLMIFAFNYERKDMEFKQTVMNDFCFKVEDLNQYLFSNFKLKKVFIRCSY